MVDLTSIRHRFGAFTEAARVAKKAEDKAWGDRYHTPHQGQCLKCLHEGKVLWWPSMTQYDDGCKCKRPIGFPNHKTDCPAFGKPDPNADLELCEVCGPEHIQEMSDQWDEYNRGLL